MLRILLAEDHAVVREGTREILERDPGFEVVGEAGDGPTAVRLTAERKPDVVLLDLGLPGMNGIEVTRRIRALPQPPQVLILSAYDDSDYVIAATEAGASGYLLKTAYAGDVAAAIYSVARGDVVYHPGAAAALVARATQRGPDTSRLSLNELDVLRLAARGRRNREIAAELSMSGRTVEAHMTRIFNKLGVASRTEAIVHAASRGWVTLETGPRLDKDGPSEGFGPGRLP